MAAVASVCATGIGRYALAKAVTYANERNVWGQPIGAHQAVAHPCDGTHSDPGGQIEAAQLISDRACRLYDAGEEVGELANKAKYLGAAAGSAALDSAIAVHGGNGVTYAYQLAPYLFWSACSTWAGLQGMIINFVAEHSLGLPRSY